MWEPLEERLLPLETTRHVSMIIITLSKKELDTSSTGYQPPLPADQVKPLNAYEEEGDGSPRMRGRGRGGRGRCRVLRKLQEMSMWEGNIMVMVGMVDVVMGAEDVAAQGVVVSGGENGAMVGWAVIWAL
ncbi:Ribonuclease P protein subunit p25 [Quillaja saponaria]|uniref:Ribonuclease P protein subunit p25 n=1 Tax=Quillaja saponaria TaxID=32244 RepID=A0AAD7KSM4_QUISA|nr:Ribonuclease P protein subunit p25 [Quillaja saponaria]KAJ7945303.1 Ribonuclease P protein subunit p25 [Quillaja saponaria]